MNNSEKASELAKFSIRQLNKPRDKSRRKDDWKLDIVIENLDKIQTLLENPNEEYQEEGGKDAGEITKRVVPLDSKTRGTHR